MGFRGVLFAVGALWAQDAVASSFVVLSASDSDARPSFVTPHSRGSFVSPAAPSQSSFLVLDAPVLASAAPEPVPGFVRDQTAGLTTSAPETMVELSPSIIAMGTPAEIAPDETIKVAALPKQDPWAMPMVIRGGLVGSALRGAVVAVPDGKARPKAIARSAPPPSPQPEPARDQQPAPAAPPPPQPGNASTRGMLE